MYVRMQSTHRSVQGPRTPLMKQYMLQNLHTYSVAHFLEACPNRGMQETPDRLCLTRSQTGLFAGFAGVYDGLAHTSK
jgi:hypothetical protein